MLLAAAIMAVAIITMASEAQIRVLESQTAAWLFSHTFADTAVANFNLDQPTVTFNVGHDWYALRITVQCTIALYLGPIMILGAALTLVRRVRTIFALLALCGSALGLILLNQARILMIGYAFETWGRDGFNWAHTIVGSALMLAGVAGSLILFFVVCLRNRPQGARSDA